MTPAEEIARFQQGLIPFTQLTDKAKDQLKNDYMVERVGFVPDILIRASGVRQMGRQALLVRAKSLIHNATDSLPIRVEWEENEYDEHALAVSIPTTKDVFGDYQAWEKVGYIPRGRCPHCGATLTGPQMRDHDKCHKCEKTIFTGEGDSRRPISQMVYFNQYIHGLIEEDRVEFGFDSIMMDPNRPNFAGGLSIGIKIKE